MLVFNPLLFWVPTVQVGFVMLEAQAVIAMRVMGMAGVWSPILAEVDQQSTIAYTIVDTDPPTNCFSSD